MAIQAHDPKNPTAGAVVTPAPTRPAAPDVISRVRQGGDAFGQNGPAGNVSSLPPGVGGPQTALGKNLKASVSDPLIDRIVQQGTARGPAANVELQSPQTRSVSDTAYPSVHGQSKRGADSGSPGGLIPSKMGASGTVAQPIRKP